MNNVENKKQIIKELIENGKKKGLLSYKEIMVTLEEIELDPEQIEKVYENIENLGIDVTGDIEDELEELKVEDTIDLSVPDGIAIDDPVRMYLKEIGKVDLLTAEEETELSQRMADGDIEARRKLAEPNLRHVVSIAKRYV